MTGVAGLANRRVIPQEGPPLFRVTTHAQLVHPVADFRRRTFVEPCGLWHDVHCILPSRTGMWPNRWSLATSVLWHVAQVSVMVRAFNCAYSDFGLCTE